VTRGTTLREHASPPGIFGVKTVVFRVARVAGVSGVGRTIVVAGAGWTTVVFRFSLTIVWTNGSEIRLGLRNGMGDLPRARDIGSFAIGRAFHWRILD
jgi:hypothetical protein